jgi:hypothetical protein
MKVIVKRRLSRVIIMGSLLWSVNSYSQTTPGDSIKPKMLNNSINLSIGPGGLLALYVPAGIFYERMFQGERFLPKLTKFVDVGVGAAAYWEGESAFVFSRYGILTGHKKYHLEATLGAVGYLNGDIIGVLPAASIGMRRQKPNSHYVFRTGVGIPEAIYVSWGVSF